MRRGSPAGLLLLAAALWSSQAGAKDAVAIPGGGVTPLFGLAEEQEELPVGPFRLDRRLVTNAQFHAFTLAHPRWAKGAPPGLFAEARYLSHWSGEGAAAAPVEGYEQAPVVFVSWFAARAYCEAAGGRLPTVLEWERAAASAGDAARILGWYARPFRMEDLRKEGAGAVNPWGVEQLHELVWEWTEDFNGVFLTGDNRQDGDRQPMLFCGAGSSAGSSRDDYAAFMRYALRSSLQGSFTLTNIGFRCAYDVVEEVRR